MSADRSATMAGRSVAILGAGITGLAAAYRLVSRNAELRVEIFEAGDRIGGIIRTERIEGFLAELGPDSFITNKPAALKLCESIGFADQLIPTDSQYRRSLVLHRGRPVPVPDGFMLMAPAKPWSILTTPVLSVRGKLRLLSEALVRADRTNQDETLGAFVRRRFGRETLDRLVQPLVGGIYTSDPEKLSLQATLPRFLEMEREHGSVIRATLRQQRLQRGQTVSSGSGARYGLFATPSQGLSSLVEALQQTLLQTERVTIRRNSPVQSVTKHQDQWRLATTSDTADSAELFDNVICTLPAHRTASLLESTSSELADELRGIEYASSAVVVSGHRLDDFQHPLDAFGLVIPHKEDRNVLAVSFTSRKFPDRAPKGCVLLRTFVGGAMQPDLLDRNDDDLCRMVSSELSDILGMRQSPIFQRVQRYDNAMPQYHLGHLDRVELIEQLVTQQPGLELAGNAYRGVGIPDSIASGEAAADRILSAT